MPLTKEQLATRQAGYDAAYKLRKGLTTFFKKVTPEEKLLLDAYLLKLREQGV